MPGTNLHIADAGSIVEAAAAVGGKAGVLFIVKNYAGDCMNFEMAAEVFEGTRDRRDQRRRGRGEINL
jgi:dihydroxyacetone kinase-like protein